jgi:hypothetical protein
MGGVCGHGWWTEPDRHGRRIDEKLAKLDEALDAMSRWAARMRSYQLLHTLITYALPHRALASAVSSGEPESKLRGMKDEIVNLCCALQHWRAIKAAHDQHKVPLSSILSCAGLVCRSLLTSPAANSRIDPLPRKSKPYLHIMRASMEKCEYELHEDQLLLAHLLGPLAVSLLSRSSCFFGQQHHKATVHLAGCGC